MKKNYKRLAISEEQIKIIEEVRCKLEKLGVNSPTYSETIEAMNLKGSPNEIIIKKIRKMRGVI